MRVLVTTTGYPGHFLPLVPFARACVRAGHDVMVAAPRSSALTVEPTGLEFRACADPPGEDLARIVGTVSELGRREGHARMMSDGFAGIAARSLLPDVLALVRRWRPDLVVRESQEYAGALAAERHAIPHVRVALGLSAHEEETLDLVAGTVDELRQELGLPGDPTANALRDSPCLTLTPLVLEGQAAPPQAMHRFREPGHGRQPPPRGGEPTVYLTLGSVAGALGLFPRVYRAALEPLAELDARVIVTVGDGPDPSELGPLPPNVEVRRWVAQEALLPHAAAVVCHGGYGSVLGALSYGVPLVAMPIFGDDQWLNARRVAEVGAGIALDDDRRPERRMFDGPPPEVFTALPGAVEAVLRQPRYSRAAGGIARNIEALPTADAAARLLEAIADGIRPRVGAS